MNALGPLAVAMFIALTLAGCSTGDTVRSKFAKDYRCKSVVIRNLGAGRYEAKGCEEHAIYDCSSGKCEMDDFAMMRSEPSTTETRDEPKTVLVVLPDERHGEGSESSGAHLEKKEGLTVVAVDVGIDKQTVLKLRATPEKGPNVVQLKLVKKYADSESADDDCELAWMIDGQRREAPKGQFASNATVAVHQVDLPRDFVGELALAQQLAFKSCDHRWSLRRAQVEQVHQFIEMYEQELAWQGDENQGTTNRLLAPNGGWPAWKNPDVARPSAKTSAPLAGTDLFKKLSPSVFQVEARGASRRSQGSAVAISNGELLTNCHVVQASRKIVVKQGDVERKAELVGADPRNDRCLLRVEEPTLTPISGVRTYESLEVGEALFTIGSPNGLELSLANGILSGRREEDGKSYVQTTAPISPGSSGGGLFDARGNLVGITTMVLVGRQRLNQALNFAIPADSFWKE